MSHYHVLATCREHSGSDVAVVETLEEACEIVHSLPELAHNVNEANLEDARSIEIVGKTKNIIDYVLTSDDGTEHAMFSTWIICPMPFELCFAMHIVETRARMSALFEQNPEYSDQWTKIQEQMNKNKDLGVVDLPATFGSIDDFLKGNSEGQAQ